MKYLLLIIASTYFFTQSENEKISIEDVVSINILDLVNHNFEYVESRYYEIRKKNEAFFIFLNKSQISQSEFDRRKFKIRNFIQRSKKQRDLETGGRYLAKKKKRYRKYVEKAKTKKIGKIEIELIEKLIEAVNSETVSFTEVWDLKKNKEYSNSVEAYIDSLFVKSSLEENTSLSFYPEISIEIITKQDTFLYHNTSQNYPPLPWIILKDGIEVKTYNEKINDVLYDIIPNRPKLNRERLGGALDSLFIEIEDSRSN